MMEELGQTQGDDLKGRDAIVWEYFERFINKSDQEEEDEGEVEEGGTESHVSLESKWMKIHLVMKVFCFFCSKNCPGIVPQEFFFSFNTIFSQSCEDEEVCDTFRIMILAVVNYVHLSNKLFKGRGAKFRKKDDFTLSYLDCLRCIVCSKPVSKDSIHGHINPLVALKLCSENRNITYVMNGVEGEEPNLVTNKAHILPIMCGDCEVKHGSFLERQFGVILLNSKNGENHRTKYYWKLNIVCVVLAFRHCFKEHVYVSSFSVLLEKISMLRKYIKWSFENKQDFMTDKLTLADFPNSKDIDVFFYLHDRGEDEHLPEEIFYEWSFFQNCSIQESVSMIHLRKLTFVVLVKPSSEIKDSYVNGGIFHLEKGGGLEENWKLLVPTPNKMPPVLVDVFMDLKRNRLEDTIKERKIRNHFKSVVRKASKKVVITYHPPGLEKYVTFRREQINFAANKMWNWDHEGKIVKFATEKLNFDQPRDLPFATNFCRVCFILGMPVLISGGFSKFYESLNVKAYYIMIERKENSTEKFSLCDIERSVVGRENDELKFHNELNDDFKKVLLERCWFCWSCGKTILGQGKLPSRKRNATQQRNRL